MRPNPFAFWPELVMLFLLGIGLPACSVAACSAGTTNPAGEVESTPTADFTVDNVNGTVTHSKTGLMWKMCPEGLSDASCGTGTATLASWADALNAANIANAIPFAGYSDWRLPNKKELESIVEFCGYSPSINVSVFPAMPSSLFWSGSSYVLSQSYAWAVDFDVGGTYAGIKANDYYVRLVRGGQSVDSFDTLLPKANVLYNGNGNTGGSVPADGTGYAAGSTATVLGNTGNLVKTGATFAGWNAAANGSGAHFAAGSTFTIASDATLYAQWDSGVGVNCSLDVDGNNNFDPLTDGLVIMRAMFGLTGAAVTSGAIGTGATRSTWSQIQPYLNANCGTAFAP